MDERVAELYEFEAFELDARKRVLTRSGHKVELTPKAIETLLLLVQGAGRTLTKEELLEGVWPDTNVEENNLNQCILALRKALGESARENRYIATVPGQGYRFVAAVRTPSSVKDGGSGSNSGVGRQSLKLAGLAALAGMLLICGLLAWRYTTHPRCGPVVGQDYEQGLGKLEEMDYLGARDLLEKAVATAPSDPQIHASLAEAWFGLGYDRDATEEAKHALALAGGCSSEKRREFQARYSEASGDWHRAISLYGDLWEHARDNVDYGLALAGALSEAGRAKEARATIQALRDSSVSARYSPRVDLVEADIAISIPDSQLEEEAAERAIKKAEDSASPRAKQLLAEGQLHKGWALTALGRPQEAQEALTIALQGFSDAGNQGGRADALNGIADLLHGEGDLVGAAKRYEEGLEVCRATHYQRCVAEDLCDVGDVLRESGDMSGAEQHYRDCLTSSEEVADKTGAALARLGQVELMIDKRQFAEAEASARDAIKNFGGQDTGVGLVDFYDPLARALLAEGKVSDALQVAGTATAPGVPAGDRCASLALAVTTARLRAASGNQRQTKDALENLEKIWSAKEQRASCYSVTLEARLAQSEVEVRSDRPGVVRDLQALEKEARSNGFGLVARRAAELSKPSTKEQ